MTKIVSKLTSKDAPWPFEKPNQPTHDSGKRFYRWHEGKFVELEPDYTPKEPIAPMIKFPTPINDFHPVTGQFVSDSSQFRRINKETGTEERDLAPVASNIPVMKATSEDDYIKDVSIAREQLLAGTAPLTDHDKYVCKQINERIKNRV